ncbi:hypothetical protein M951_chr3161 (nucleomorph) [Lotharella oceanica]|uniref:Uncharacterized protein n=1 Tax=Lotharella oceanica TaxID=641309 RepID=A0A060DAQ3_9EUKA|nr:hypothetical protein M951_chr144 [Lotharella oceanica]AIB09666.1 hypothetical protein M951_chr1187 [Lotharella oceanica]AIB09747.1 hypothetical protein M951_chr244 [Lotharella oceanica]AIB09869.1 hypothetical protein M951_chr2177 [Lotharella oceanica]AIB09950.1 hypothetical protein M951_chr344 [Lotharella oceanica]
MPQRMKMLIGALLKKEIGSSIRGRLRKKDLNLLQDGILFSIQNDKVALFANLKTHFLLLGMKSKILSQYSAKHLTNDSKRLSFLKSHLQNVDSMCQWMKRLSKEDAPTTSDT